MKDQKKLELKYKYFCKFKPGDIVYRTLNNKECNRNHPCLFLGQALEPVWNRAIFKEPVYYIWDFIELKSQPVYAYEIDFY